MLFFIYYVQRNRYEHHFKTNYKFLRLLIKNSQSKKDEYIFS